MLTVYYCISLPHELSPSIWLHDLAVIQACCGYKYYTCNIKSTRSCGRLWGVKSVKCEYNSNL